MEQRLKICLGCRKPQKIFSHGLCLRCFQYADFKSKTNTNKPRSTAKVYEGITLTEKVAFERCFKLWGGKNFLTGKQMILSNTVAGNFAHVLSKKMFEWFRYLPANIVLLTFEQHQVFDHGTREQMLERAKEFPQEDWLKLIMYKGNMKKLYEEWTRENIKTYKLNT